MIGGVIAITQPMKVVFRALGPTLTTLGVAGALADPQLELHDAHGTIATNDNWQTTQIGGALTASQAAEIHDSGYAPPSAKESVIIATLQPGNYTAIVRGANNTTGVALVEVYRLQ